MTPQPARKNVVKKRSASTRSPAPKKKQTKKTTVNLDEETNTEYVLSYLPENDFYKRYIPLIKIIDKIIRFKYI